MAVASVNAMTLVFASSKVTVAVLSSNQTSALLTPGTVASVFLTM